MKTLLLLLLLASPGAYAQEIPASTEGRTIIEREIACPVCGTQFYTKLNAGSASYDQRLDLKPVGDVNGPWLLPECPKCGFVIFKAGLTKAELARCKAAVALDDYKKAIKRSSYYRAGLLYEQLEKPPFSVAMNFLKASWQEEPDPVFLKEDQELALRYFSDAVKAAKAQNEDLQNAQLMRGELMRRLGKFGPAKEHFRALLGQPGFKKNFLGDIAAFQVKLCEKEDAQPHVFQEVRDFTKPPHVRLWILTKKFFADLAAVFAK
jgi:tetratricopeptide (TPR) repeat protein